MTNDFLQYFMIVSTDEPCWISKLGCWLLLFQQPQAASSETIHIKTSTNLL